MSHCQGRTCKYKLRGAERDCMIAHFSITHPTPTVNARDRGYFRSNIYFRTSLFLYVRGYSHFFVCKLCYITFRVEDVNVICFLFAEICFHCYCQFLRLISYHSFALLLLQFNLLVCRVVYRN